MGDKYRRRMLENGGDGDGVHAGLPGLQRLAVIAEGAVRLTRRHQLHDVDLRAAHFNLDIEAGVFIQPLGLGLIETTVFRLGIPVGQESKFFRREAGCRGGDGRKGQHRVSRSTHIFHQSSFYSATEEEGADCTKPFQWCFPQLAS